DSRNAGWGRYAHDRPRHVDRVLQQQRLADGRCGDLRHGAAASGAHGAVPVRAGAPARNAGRAPMTRPNPRLRALFLGAGYAFLYVPILVLMVLSFNDSAMMTTWTGFSLRWYPELFADRALLEAARVSLIIAAF